MKRPKGVLPVAVQPLAEMCDQDKLLQRLCAVKLAMMTGKLTCVRFTLSDCHKHMQ